MSGLPVSAELIFRLFSLTGAQSGPQVYERRRPRGDKFKLFRFSAVNRRNGTPGGLGGRVLLLVLEYRCQTSFAGSACGVFGAEGCCCRFLLELGDIHGDPIGEELFARLTLFCRLVAGVI